MKTVCLVNNKQEYIQCKQNVFKILCHCAFISFIDLRLALLLLFIVCSVEIAALQHK